MADEPNPGDLLKVKVDPTGGAELTVGNNLPWLVEKLLPNRWVRKRKIDQVISEKIIEKIGLQEVLDEPELAFIQTSMSEDAERYLRLRAVQDRAVQIIEAKEVAPKQLTAGTPLEDETRCDVAEEEAEEVRTSEDWLLKFREDAGLVDDAEVREIYASILAEESVAPRSFSLKTLGVLRYLDSGTLRLFEKALRLEFSGRYIPPHHETMSKDLYESIGLKYGDLLTLEDAGLLHVGSTTRFQTKGHPSSPHFLFSARHLDVIYLIDNNDGKSFELDIPVYVLTPTGTQLSSIAVSAGDNNKSTVVDLGRWLKKVSKNRVRYCKLPSSAFDAKVTVQLDQLVTIED